MPIASWPASLPQKPLADGFSETSPDLVARTQMDTGPAKMRRRATAGVTQVKCAFRLTADQLATFRDFMHSDLQDRALPYSWAHPVAGAVGRWRITASPTIEPIADGLAWKVALALELLP